MVLMVLEEESGCKIIDDFLSIDTDKCYIFYAKDCLVVNDFTKKMSEKFLNEYILVNPIWTPRNFFERFFAKSIKVSDIVKRLGVKEVDFKTNSMYGNLLYSSFYIDLEPVEKYLVLLDCYAFLSKKLIIHNLGLSPLSMEKVSKHINFLYENGYRFVEFYFDGINTEPILSNIPHKKIILKIL